MNNVNTQRLGKDLLSLLAFALLLAALVGALLGSHGAPMMIVMAMAFTVPATVSAAVRLYRDLSGEQFSA